MLSKLLCSMLIFTSIFFSACGGGISAGDSSLAEQVEFSPETQGTLDELAALERAGLWIQGLGLTESVLRETSGDFAGAVAAAYKELSWARGMGFIQNEDVKNGLLGLLELNANETVAEAANAILAFENEEWPAAEAALKKLFDESKEPDGFARWMLLVCALEQNREDRKSAEAYKAIRARYVQSAEYWYRGAKAFNGVIAAEYAENCINLASDGPFADECKKILADLGYLQGLEN